MFGRAVTMDPLYKRNNCRKLTRFYYNSHALKNEAVCYSVFWNPELNGGLGDIEIQKIDLLNLAWQTGIINIRESKYLLYSNYMDKEEFTRKYGKESCRRWMTSSSLTPTGTITLKS